MNRKPEQACSTCGRPVRTLPYARSGSGYCCESCFLASTAGAIAGENLDAFAEALVETLDMREHETGLHSRRVACHTLELARLEPSADAHTLRQIYWGALLHDIGKIGIPDSVLLKQGPLSESEWVEMRTHCEKGHAIVSKIPGMQEAAKIVLAHEEHFDGSGYPYGLAGSDIPWGARLFAVVDALDAITSDRPYRKALTFEAAKQELAEKSGSQFAPEAIALFLRGEGLMRKMVELKCGTAHARDLFNQ